MIREIFNQWRAALVTTDTPTAPEQQQTAAERLETLRKRHAEVTAAIRRGEIDEETLLEEKELTQRLQVAELAYQAEQGKAHRAAIAARQADLEQQAAGVMKELNTHVVGLKFACQDLQRLIDDVHANGGIDGNRYPTMEQFFGVPVDFPDKIERALHDAAPSTEWAYVMPGHPAEPPTLATEGRTYQLAESAGYTIRQENGATFYDYE